MSKELDTSPRLIYYGTTDTEATAEALISYKTKTDEWRLLVPPSPVIKAFKVEGGTIINQQGVWFMLHRFHKVEELGAQ